MLILLGLIAKEDLLKEWHGMFEKRKVQDEITSLKTT